MEVSWVYAQGELARYVPSGTPDWNFFLSKRSLGCLPLRGVRVTKGPGGLRLGLNSIRFRKAFMTAGLPEPDLQEPDTRKQAAAAPIVCTLFVKEENQKCLPLPSPMPLSEVSCCCSCGRSAS